MTERNSNEVIATNARLLLNRWQTEALPNERFEYLDRAVDLMTEGTQEPLPIISMMCANYETFKIQGKKRPTLHREMVWNDRGLRRGYVLCHDEIPHRLDELQKTIQKPINHLIVLVDLGMAETLLSPLNPRVAELDQITIEEDINQCLNENTTAINRLVNHGLQLKNQTGVTSTIQRLTNIIPPEFYEHWSDWNQRLRLSLQQPNNPWGGQIRKDLAKDARYYAETWGLETREALYKRVIDQQYGLTATIGDWLNQIHNTMFQQNLRAKSDLILLDTIPGPDNPAHAEFMAYNYDEPDGTPRQKTSILRPMYNLVLLSDPAIIPNYLGKSSDEIMDEANQYGF